MIVWLTDAADPSSSAQVDVAPSRAELIKTYEGSRRTRNRAGRFVAPPCIMIRSFYVVKVPVLSEEKTDSASSTPTPCRRSSPSAKTAGKSVHSNFL